MMRKKFHHSTAMVAMPEFSINKLSQDSKSSNDGVFHFIALSNSGQANIVGLFNVADGSPYHLFDAPGSFGNSSGVAISQDGKLAAAVYANTLRTWNVQ
jgi:hypothetical protein